MVLARGCEPLGRGLVFDGVGLATGGSAALLAALVTLAVGLVGLYAWRSHRPGTGAPEPQRRAD